MDKEILERIEEIEARAAKATPGPWRAHIRDRSVWAHYDRTIGWPKFRFRGKLVHILRKGKYERIRCPHAKVDIIVCPESGPNIDGKTEDFLEVCSSFLDDFDYRANLDFVAHAREDVPWLVGVCKKLLARVRKLEAVAEAVRELVKQRDRRVDEGIGGELVNFLDWEALEQALAALEEEQ